MNSHPNYKLLKLVVGMRTHLINPQLQSRGTHYAINGDDGEDGRDDDGDARDAHELAPLLIDD